MCSQRVFMQQRQINKKWFTCYMLATLYHEGLSWSWAHSASRNDEPKKKKQLRWLFFITTVDNEVKQHKSRKLSPPTTIRTKTEQHFQSEKTYTHPSPDTDCPPGLCNSCDWPGCIFCSTKSPTWKTSGSGEPRKSLNTSPAREELSFTGPYPSPDSGPLSTFQLHIPFLYVCIYTLQTIRLRSDEIKLASIKIPIKINKKHNSNWPLLFLQHGIISYSFTNISYLAGWIVPYVSYIE